MTAMPLPLDPSSPSSGGRLVATDGRALPYRGADLAVDAMGGLARVTLRQVFENPYDEPLRLTYTLPLPTDAAVAGFAFELADRRIQGEVDLRHRARERFEEAILDGRSAALLEEERSSVFTQELGNVPPRSRVVCEVQLDQRLAWRAEGAWEWRFPTVVAPRYLGADGRVPDAPAVLVDVDAAGTSPRARLALRVRDPRTGPATSPSHALHAVQTPDGLDLGLADEGGAALDRDLVVRWPVAALAPGLVLDRARPAAGRPHGATAYGLLTVVPPAPTAPVAPVGRDLVVLLDTSGSMSGSPLAQAKAVTLALLDSLCDRDTIQLIEFSVRPRAWQDAPVQATAAHRVAARAWVEGLRAGGGTEMREGILAALATLRGEAQRQVVLVTDGLIGFEREIVEAVATRLPRGSRVHCLGIGSAVNRTLTGGVARAGGGVEAIVGVGEDPAAAAAALVARTDRPLVVDLELEGAALLGVAHHRLPDLYAGAPARIAVRLRPEGGGLVLRGHTAAGPWEQRLDVPATAPGLGNGAVVALYGREEVERLELEAARGRQVDAELEQLGLHFQIATRRTSWVAISHEQTVDATAPTRREVIPQALPHGMSVEALGLRPAHQPAVLASMAPPPPPAPMGAPQAARLRAAPKRQRGPIDAMRDLGEAMFGGRRAQEAPPAAAADEERDAFVPASPSLSLRSLRNLRGARVVLHKDGRLVLEVTLDAALDWRAPTQAELLLGDESTLVVPVLAERCTRAALLPAGAVLRVVLEVGALAHRLVAVELGDLRLLVSQ